MKSYYTLPYLFTILVIGLFSFTDSFAQKKIPEVSTFNLQEEDNPNLKITLSINTSKKEIDLLYDKPPVRKLKYYDYKRIDQLVFTFSLLSDVKAPDTVEKFLDSRYCLLVTSEYIALKQEIDEISYWVINMDKDPRLEQFANLMINLSRLKPEEQKNKPSTSANTKTNPTTRQNSTSTRTTTNTNSNSVTSNISEAKRLFAQKEMDVVRMAKYPLGFISPNTRTRDEVKKQTDACGVSYDVSRETNTLFDSDGYNLKWHGKSPLDVCINMGGTHWDNWEYTFIYNTNEEGLMRAKEIESSLRSQMGLNWSSPKGNSSKFYYRECEQNGVRYVIDYKEYNSTSYHLNFNIYRLKDDSSTTRSTTTTANSSNEIKAWFNKIWVEHNVYENGRKGMRIHSHFFVNNALSLQMSINYYFYYNDNRALRDTNNSYHTVDGQVCCFSGIKPGYTQTEYKDLVLFMPYDELHLGRGNYNLKFRGEIHYAGKSYGISDWVYFTFTQ